MESNGQSFWQVAKKYSGHWHAEHLSQPLDSSALASLEAEAQASIERQRELEADDDEPFEAYLARFYSQYSS
jgi:glutamate--cysteine ligase